MQGEFSVINRTKVKLPSLPFSDIKNDILGKEYSLSIAFVGEKDSQAINKKYRNKDKAANILSFPFSKNNGEILLCPQTIKKQAGDFDRDFPSFVGFLVIHGMLHLKGMQHSSRMEVLEKKYDKKYFGGYRRGVDNNESCCRGVSKGRKKS